MGGSMDSSKQPDPVAEAPAVAPVAAPVATPSADEGVKSYLVMVTLAFFASVTGLARAYRGEKVGWVRFWMFVGSCVAIIVPLLNILAGLVQIILWIWGIVDFFLVYRLRDDAAGKPLHVTPRDMKWAGVFNVLYIIGIALMGVAIILGIIFSAAIMSNIGNISKYESDSSSSSYSSSSSSSSSDSTKKQELLDAYDQISDGMSKADAESKLGTPSDTCSEYTYGSSKTESCTYGSYSDGVTIMVTYDNDSVSSKSKY